jgi:DNA-directed RNA polymerase sigma subunit (sigma70/sigma32)
VTKLNPISLDEEIEGEGDTNLYNFVPDDQPSPFELMNGKFSRKRLLEIIKKELDSKEEKVIIMIF